MSPPLAIALAGGLGLLLGHLHFALLRRAVEAWAAGRCRGFWLRRLAGTLASAGLLALVAALAGLPALLAAALGFLLARTLHLRRAAGGRP